MELASTLRGWFGGRVLGPDKPVISKVKSLEIRKIVLKFENGMDMKKVREYLLFAERQIMQDPRYRTLQVYYDVDPQ